MIIHCFHILSICRSICKGENLSDRNAEYFIAGAVEMLVFDFVMYGAFIW